MKTAIKYVLAYFAILNFIAPMCVAAVVSLYGYLAHGAFSFSFITKDTILPAQLTGMVLMVLYLYADRALGIGRRTVKPVILLSSFGAWLGTYWLVSLMMRYMSWVPNIMEQTFEDFMAKPLGILSLVIVGPIVEELLFRRAVTDALLKSYSKWRSIFLSALIFGLFHINPAQILPAFLLGLLFAWIYCETRSLIPTIILHVVSNGFSTYLATRTNPIDDVTMPFTTPQIVGITIAATILLAISLIGIKKNSSVDFHL